MASGKQFNFSRGEVSPPFRYKSASVTYQEGLHKLRNGFTRRGGGVSNRPGFAYIGDLPNNGVPTRGSLSNSRLIYVNRTKEFSFETSDRELYFLSSAPHMRVDIYELSRWNQGGFSQGSNLKRIVGFQNAATSSPLYSATALNVKDNIWISFGSGNAVQIPYSYIDEEGLRTSELAVHREELYRRHGVVDNFLYAGISQNTPPMGSPAENNDIRPVLLIHGRPNAPTGGQGLGARANRGIEGAYIITAQYDDGTEQVVCGYRGPWTTYQGWPVEFWLISGAWATKKYDSTFRFTTDSYVAERALESSQQLLATHFQRRNKGVLLLQDGTNTLQVGGFGQVAYTFGIKANEGWTVLTGNELDQIKALGDGVAFGDYGNSTNRLVVARDDGVIFNLYRGLSFESSLSLVASASASYSSGITLASPVVLRDSSATVSIASRTIRDRLRLYALSGRSRHIYPGFIEWEEVDQSPDPRLANNAVHRLYRPYVPSDVNTLDQRFVELRTVSRMMRYQQRMFISYTVSGPRLTSANSLLSVIGVSKINSDIDFTLGQVVNPVDAFEFNVPLDDSGRVVAMLGSERPLIFTVNRAYMLLGGENGIVTPTEINPLVIYSGGCSDTVQPVLIDNTTFFLNNDHSSVVMIEFNASGGRGVSLIETDTHAKHFLEKSIIQMAVTKSFETVVWLLREDGSLLSMTRYDDNVFGFGLHELSDGFIENITATRMPMLYQERIHQFNDREGWRVPDVEVLAATIIRDDNRTLEVMHARDDNLPENMCYMDSFIPFGGRLVEQSDGSGFVDLRGDESRRLQLSDVSGNTFVSDADLNAVHAALTSYWNVLLTATSGGIVDKFFAGTPTVSQSTLRSIAAAMQFPDLTTFKTQFDTTDTDLYADIDIDRSSNFFKFRVPAVGSSSHVYSFMPSIILDNLNMQSTPEGVSPTHIVAQIVMYTLFAREVLHNGPLLETLTPNQQQFLIRMLVDGGVAIPRHNLRDQVVLHRDDRAYYFRKNSDSAKVVYKSRLLDHPDSAVEIFNRVSSLGLRDSVGSWFSTNTSTLKRLNINLDYINNADDVRISMPYSYNPGRFIDDRLFLLELDYTLEGADTIPLDYTQILERKSNDGTPLSREEIKHLTNWSGLTNRVTGLQHLANKQVSVFADNETVSNPLTEDERFKDQILTVDENGVLELPDYYQWGLVGLPYKFEMESLQIEAQDDRTLIAGKKVVNKLSLALHRSREGIHVSSIRGFEYDENEDQSYPIYDEKIREQSIDPTNKTFSGAVEPFLASGWSEGGRVRITNSDPTPVTVNAIYPKGIESGD